MQNDIGSLLHAVSKALDEISDQILSERLGIGLSQFRVLLYLLGEDGASQHMIAVRLGQSAPSISRQIKLLQQKGLVVVRVNASSRRDRLVFLTQKGAKTAEKSVNILNEYHAPMFSRLSQKEQEQLVETLRSIKNYIEE